MTSLLVVAGLDSRYHTGGLTSSPFDLHLSWRKLLRMPRILWPGRPRYLPRTLVVIQAVESAYARPSGDGLQGLAAEVGLSADTLLRAVQALDPRGEIRAACRLSLHGGETTPSQAVREALVQWAAAAALWQVQPRRRRRPPTTRSPQLASVVGEE